MSVHAARQERSGRYYEELDDGDIYRRPRRRIMRAEAFVREAIVVCAFERNSLVPMREASGE